jgi:hypothetical protein
MVSNGCPTSNFVAPEAIPAANPMKFSIDKFIFRVQNFAEIDDLCGDLDLEDQVQKIAIW